MHQTDLRKKAALYGPVLLSLGILVWLISAWCAFSFFQALVCVGLIRGNMIL